MHSCNRASYPRGGLDELPNEWSVKLEVPDTDSSPCQLLDISDRPTSGGDILFLPLLATTRTHGGTQASSWGLTTSTSPIHRG